MAVRYAVVTIGVGITVMMAELVELLKTPDGTKVAVMVLLPASRPLPGTLTVAVADVPLDGVTADEPMEFPPTVNVTLPAGTAVPVTALTVAVSCAALACGRVVGVATNDVVDATRGATLDQLAARL